VLESTLKSSDRPTDFTNDSMCLAACSTASRVGLSTSSADTVLAGAVVATGKEVKAPGTCGNCGNCRWGSVLKDCNVDAAVLLLGYMG
jgi:hypothetical protein